MTEKPIVYKIKDQPPDITAERLVSLSVELYNAALSVVVGGIDALVLAEISHDLAEAMRRSTSST